MAKERNITKPQVGDVRSVVDGTTNYYTSQNLPRMNGTNRVETPTAMGANTLNSNESLIQIPNVPSTGNLESTGGYLESFSQSQDQFITDRQTATDTARKEKDATFNDYIKGLSKEESLDALKLKSEQEFGAPALEEDLNRINADLMAEQRALKNRIDSLNKNAMGGLASGVAGEIANAQRESYSKQADMAIVQLAAQGRFDSAKAMADRKASILFDSQTRNLAIRERIYEENKDTFTKEEQRLFETVQGDRNRKLEQERADFTKLQDVKLDALRMAQMNGAPVSVLEAIERAESPVQVLEAGGQYGSVDMLDRQVKQQQLASSRTSQLLALAEAGDENAIKELKFDPRSVEVEVDPVVKRQVEEQIIGTEQLLDLASQYRNIVDTYGYTNEVFGNPKIVGQVNSLRAQMTAAYKKAETLGTLDAGVLKLMDQILGAKPTSSVFGIGDEGNITANITTNRSKKIVSAIDELIATTQASNAKAKMRIGINPTVQSTLTADEEAELNKMLGVQKGEFNPDNYYTQ